MPLLEDGLLPTGLLGPLRRQDDDDRDAQGQRDRQTDDERQEREQHDHPIERKRTILLQSLTVRIINRTRLTYTSSGPQTPGSLCSSASSLSPPTFWIIISYQYTPTPSFHPPQVLLHLQVRLQVVHHLLLSIQTLHELYPIVLLLQHGFLVQAISSALIRYQLILQIFKRNQFAFNIKLRSHSTPRKISQPW